MEIHEETGPLLLLAGPGTGKTYRLAQRIKYLCVEKSVSQENITVITFTNAAAKNMKERISDSSAVPIFTPPEKQPKLICTIHSLGFKIIGENAKYLGYKNQIRVLEPDAVKDQLIEDAAYLTGFKREEAKNTISCRQNGKCQPSDVPKCKICKKYRQILKSCSAIDYDDQILLANEILINKPEVLADFKRKCSNLLIDEYQDINAAQFELIKLLTEEQEEGLFAVGDDDQSIYSWRGGNPEYIRKFKNYFGDKAKITPLLKSYRCPQFILESALEVVKAFDKDRLEKGDFEYENKADGKIKIHNVASDNKEALLVQSIIKKRQPLKKVLILIPGRRFASPLINILKNSSINFYAPLNFPGEGFPIIKLLAKWIQNPNDSIALRQIFSKLIENKSFGVPSSKSRKKETLEKREAALNLISSIWKDVINNNAKNLWSSLEQNYNKDEFLKKLYESLIKFQKTYNIQENIQDFFSSILQAVMPWKNNKEFLDEVIAWIDTTNYLSNQKADPDVEIMTLQGAKGLEADIVCIIGMENGSLPRNIDDMDKIPEESRLMLVSMTRAKEELHIFHARKRSGSRMFSKTFKDGKATFSKSIFIDSIPPKYIDKQYHPA